MEVSAIKDVVSQIITTSGISGITPSHRKSQDDIFAASMLKYLMELHVLVMSSWERFADDQSDIAKEKTRDHRTMQQRKSEEKARDVEGQKRQIEGAHFGTHRQAGKFRHFQGLHLGEGRHLHLAL